MEPIRILRVVGSLNRGGLETIIMNAYRLIDRSKIQFDFVMHTEKEGHYCAEIRSMGGRIYSVPKYTGKNHFAYKRAWDNFFEQHREYKVIHGHMMTTAALYLNIARKHGLYTICHSHAVKMTHFFPALKKRVLQLPLKRKNAVDFMLACSNEAGEYLFGRNNIKEKNYKVIKNAIDVKKFRFHKEIRQKMRRQMGLEEKFVIGHVGRFSTEKNHKFLIEVFQEVLKIKDNAVLVLIGTGVLQDSIHSLVKSCRLEEKVLFMGVRDDVYQCMQMMDIFVFPSLFEGFGNVLVEAQAAGLPCVVSDVITKEVVATDLIQFISLHQPKSVWAERILTSGCSEVRQDTALQVIEAGFDVYDTVKWYEKFYMKCYQEALQRS